MFGIIIGKNFSFYTSLHKKVDKSVEKWKKPLILGEKLLTFVLFRQFM